MIIKNIPLFYEVVYSTKRKRCAICSLRPSLLLWIANLPLLSLICSCHLSFLPSETLIPPSVSYYDQAFSLLLYLFPLFLPSLRVLPSTWDPFRNIYHKWQSCCFSSVKLFKTSTPASCLALAPSRRLLQAIGWTQTNSVKVCRCCSC